MDIEIDRSDPSHVLITGASRGLGAGFAQAFSAAGHPVSLLARNTNATAALAATIQEKGRRAVAIGCDVIDARSVAQAVGQAASALGKIGILINNAGVVEPVESVRDADPRMWRLHIESNLIGAFNILHFAIPHLERGATVVNVSSDAGNRPVAGRSPYCASKAGLNMLSRVFELEEASAQAFRVFTFTPGPTDTEMHTRIRSAPINQNSIYKPPLLHPVDDAAKFLLWLCSEAAADLAGTFVNARDPQLRSRAGLA